MEQPKKATQKRLRRGCNPHHVMAKPTTNSESIAIAMQRLVAWALLTAVVLWQYSHTLDAWWRWDDTQILAQAVLYAPWQYFFSAEAWRFLSAAHFTPWVTASFDIDLALFGLSARGFYLHQLLALLVAAGLLFETLRIWIKPWLAFIGGLAFCLSAPAMMIAEQLMTRHYIEGLIFALAALIFYEKARKRDDARLAWVGACFYLFASLAKEIYVPLPGLLLMWPRQHWRQGVRLVGPYVLLALCYFVWRAAILGVIVGGYGGVLNAEELSSIPARAVAYLFGSGVSFWLAIGVLAILAAILVRKYWFRMVGISVLLIIPLGAVSQQLSASPENMSSGRYLIIVAAALVVLLPFAAQACRRAATKGLILSIGAAFLIWPLWDQKEIIAANLSKEAARQEAQGRFYWSGKPADILWADVGRFHYYLTGLKALRRDEGPEIVSDEIELVGWTPAEGAVWAFSRDCACMEDVTARLGEEMEAWAARRRRAPLSVDLGVAPNGLLYWEFGPYETGRYFAVSGADFGRLPLGKEGSVRTAMRQFGMYVRYDSPDGWTTYSPFLKVDLDAARTLSWKRP